MYADDTTVYYIEDKVDKTAIPQNRASSELNKWWLKNSLTPYVEPQNSVIIGVDRIIHTLFARHY